MATAKKITQAKPKENNGEIPFDQVGNARLTIFQANGDKFSSFTDHAKAIAWLVKAVNACPDEDTLNLLVEHNEESIAQVDVGLANQFHTAVNVRYQHLGAQPAQDNNPPHDPVTGEILKDAAAEAARVMGEHAREHLAEKMLHGDSKGKPEPEGLLRPGETEVPPAVTNKTEGEVRAMNEERRGGKLPAIQQTAKEVVERLAETTTDDGEGDDDANGNESNEQRFARIAERRVNRDRKSVV